MVGFVKSGAGVTAVLAIGLALAPASGAPELRGKTTTAPSALRGSIGYFTPAAGDPKLAQMFARGALSTHGFRFTPVTDGRNSAVTVAVRASVGHSAAETVALARARIAPNMAPAAAPSSKSELEIKPVSYSLGSAVGWKRFAAPAKAPEFDPSALSAAREKLASGIIPKNSKWDTNVRVAEDRKLGVAPGTFAGSKNMSVDVAGSYRLTRNLDLSAGVRIRSDRDRLGQAADPRQDSQAVYLGTTFRF
jgi:hypothetical protein